jgi:predicted nucleotidyltransferase component of viral defense system
MFHLTTVEPETYQLLQKLFELPVIMNGFALAGGTSLALQIGHRKSVNLDLFSENIFSIEDLEIELRSSHTFSTTVTNKNRRMLFTLIDSVKCDFVNEPAKIINPHIKFENALLYSVPDIAAMKLHTICGRGKRKDFFDIYALLQSYSWEDLLSFFERKYTADQLFFVWRSIVYFEDAENDFEIEGLGKYNMPWKEIKEYIKETCIKI